MAKKQLTFAKFIMMRMPSSAFACVYCGEMADTRDHTSPQSLYRVLDSFAAEEAAKSIVGVMVPACRECNSMLGTCPKWVLGERIAEHKKRFYRKYRKSILRAIWDESEIEECGRGLRSAIAAMNEADIVSKRRYEFRPPEDYVIEVEMKQLDIDLEVRNFANKKAAS